jgi:prepilin peptidase CpaA
MGWLPTLDTPLAIALGVLVLVAAAFDLRYRRIPNWLAAAGFLMGLVLNVWLGGASAVPTVLTGAALALCVYLPLYALRAVGGGDLKLMAAVGAIAGPTLWLVLFVVTSLLGGAAALVLVIAKGRLGPAMSNIGAVFVELLHLRGPYRAHPDLDVTSASATGLPHGAIIAVAVLLCLAAIHQS